MFVSSVYHPARENAIRKQEEGPAKGEKAVGPHGGYLPKSAKRAAADTMSAAAW